MLAYVVGRPCAYFTAQNVLSHKDGLEYEHIGCKIDSLHLMHCFGELER